MTRPDRDKELVDIADYVCDADIDSNLAFETAHLCLMDALACGFQALDDPACTKLLGPVVPGATLSGGARVPGTSYELDPVTAAFNIGAMVRWLDFNDASLAAEWGHPSDNLGGILAVADYLSRRNRVTGEDPLTISDVLTAMIRAFEIQGRLAPGPGDDDRDHAPLVRVATAAVVTRLLGGGRLDVLNALSHAWISGDALRSGRRACSHRGWAAGDATSGGVRIALIFGRGNATDDEDSPVTDRAVPGTMSWRRETGNEDFAVLQKKFVDSVSPRLGAGQWEALDALCADRDKLAATAVDDFMALLVA